MAKKKTQVEAETTGDVVMVDFGTVSVGDETASIGVKVPREKLTIEQAENLFCGTRLTGVAEAVPADTLPDQKRIPGTFSKVKGVFDSKRVSLSPKEYSARLQFSLGEIQAGDLAGMAKRCGRLTVDLVQPLDIDDEDDEP